MSFLALPLELRLEIYRLCVMPENLNFICSYNMYEQNRPRGWVEPSWHSDRSLDRYDDDDDDVREEWERIRGSATTAKDRKAIDDEDDYERTSLDDYSHVSRRYQPRMAQSRRSGLPGLLLVCRQITDEVQSILYARNTFTVDVHRVGQDHLGRLFSPETRQQMRKMVLVFRPMGVSYGRPDFCMDPKIWDGVLGRLSILGVIAEQPELLFPPAWNRPDPQDVFDKWTSWLTPILEYVDKALPGAAQVVVDANKKEETVQMFEKAMPGRCHFQRLRAADPIFERGEKCSWMHGYWEDHSTRCRPFMGLDADCDLDDDDDE